MSKKKKDKYKFFFLNIPPIFKKAGYTKNNKGDWIKELGDGRRIHGKKVDNFIRFHLDTPYYKGHPVGICKCEEVDREITKFQRIQKIHKMKELWETNKKFNVIQYYRNLDKRLHNR